MRISFAHQFVFLAYPRTGSTSIRRALEPYADIRSRHVTQLTDQHPFYHHMSAAEAKDAFDRKGWDWRSMRTFCVVRNPWDRVVSLYHLHLNLCIGKMGEASLKQRAKSFARTLLRGRPSFRQFVESLDPTKGLTQDLAHFAQDETGRWLVDDVLRYEDLAYLPEYLGSVGIPVGHIPHLNQTHGRADYHAYYDDRLARMVGELYERDVDCGGYRFDAEPALAPSMTRPSRERVPMVGPPVGTESPLGSEG